MIPSHLEKLIWEKRGISFSHTFGGGGLSAYKIAEGQTLVVWSVQVFPFFDLDNDLLQAAEDRWNEKVARGVHWFEFADKTKRYGLAHRSSHIETNSTTGGDYDFPYPLADSPVIPVYWIFHGEELVCRVTRLPSPGVSAYESDVPPPQRRIPNFALHPSQPGAYQCPGFWPRWGSLETGFAPAIPGR